MRLVLTDRKQVAESAMAFFFTPEIPLKFTAGQFGYFSLSNPTLTDAKSDTRTFSFASSPTNAQIMIATRMSKSAFKENLRRAPIGTAVEFQGPMGNFTLHTDDSRPAVFLTGGIGITPVRSIVENATQCALPHKLFVFYSNRTLSASAFIDDFKAWDHDNQNLRFIPTLTEEKPQDWSDEIGFINERMLRKHLPDVAGPIYYIVGPPMMVMAMKKVLTNLHLDETQIRTEDFTGY